MKFIISISLRIVRRCKKGKWEAVTRRMIDNTMAKRILRKRKCGLSAVQWLVNCIFYLWYSAFREVVFFLSDQCCPSLYFSELCNLLSWSSQCLSSMLSRLSILLWSLGFFWHFYKAVIWFYPKLCIDGRYYRVLDKITNL